MADEQSEPRTRCTCGYDHGRIRCYFCGGSKDRAVAVEGNQP